MKLLHRHSDFVSFASKSEGNFYPKIAVRVGSIEATFPTVLSSFSKDSYVSINAAFRTQRSRTGLSQFRPCHNTASLSYLCACYCDIDFYNKDLTAAEVLAGLDAMWRTGMLPKASIILNSGHGLWLLWLLHDANDPSMAHHGAFSDNPHNHLLLYRQINQRIGQLLSHLGADHAATDAARFIRIPGSLHMGTEETVAAWIDGGNESPGSYSLHELASLLGIKRPVRNTRATLGRNTQPRSKGNESQRVGYRAAVQNKLKAFKALIGIRGGGFRDGHRNNAAWMYVLVQKQNGVTHREIEESLLVMSANCTPPLGEIERRGAIKTGYKAKMTKLSYQYVANVLGVTMEESEAITTVLRKPFPPSVGHSDGTDQAHSGAVTASRPQRNAMRRASILEIVRTAGAAPSLRGMEGQLLALGMNASHVTIRRDYRALGLTPSKESNMPMEVGRGGISSSSDEFDAASVIPSKSERVNFLCI